jgi:SNF2 family DNA or RNA helicase
MHYKWQVELIKPNEVKLSWYKILAILREYSPLQKQLDFRFKSDSSSETLIQRFISEQKARKQAQDSSVATLSEQEIQEKLIALGFTKRTLKDFQIRDVKRLTSLPNGANFSVPGAGKTTVTLAVHLLTTTLTDKLFVVCPKSAFPAWTEILAACFENEQREAFGDGTFLNVSQMTDDAVIEAFKSTSKYFVTNYENFANRKELFAFVLASFPVHLVLDESHRMKAGQMSQRGAALLSVANLPIRRDILSGTPMPQGPDDIKSQLDFLWPGSSMGSQITRGVAPSEVIDGLFTRTTKKELDLPKVVKVFHRVEMSPAQAALYGIVKNDFLREQSSFRDDRGVDIIKARKSVMRLLQLSSNPILAIRSISQDIFLQDHGVINALMQEPISNKMSEACRLVRENASLGKKTLLWTIFTQNILDLEKSLSDLNSVTIYGAIPSGAEIDDNTREGKIRRFHDDPTCMVLIANPAAASEGISLHLVCHDAIYLDRNYISTQFLQSIDRIHRLGLEKDVVTTITILQSSPPAGLGSIDYSVSRRLTTKILELQKLLNDEDLLTIALDEENAPEPVNYQLTVEDVADLIKELEGQETYDDSVSM